MFTLQPIEQSSHRDSDSAMKMSPKPPFSSLDLISCRKFPHLCSTGAAVKDHLDLALRLETIRLSVVGKSRERSFLSAGVHASEQEEQDLFQKGWQSAPAAYAQDE
jgi:hypothetical protein